MYLSRLILNPRNRQVQSDLSSPYQLHRTVMSGFATGKVQIDRSAPDAAGVLYRLDSNVRQGLLTLLVQSQTQPDWTALPTGYLLPFEPFSTDENPAVKPFKPQFARQQMLHFRLLANPTKRLGKRAGADKGKRVGLYKADEQTAWLQRKAQQGGFRLISVRPSQEQMQRGTIRRAEASHPLKLYTVRFDGVWQAVDPDQLLGPLPEGIGTAKALGGGLLWLARTE